MSVLEVNTFFAILLLMTFRTLAFRRFAAQLPAEATSWIVGLATVVLCLCLLPVAWHLKLMGEGRLTNHVGIFFGLLKGVLLAILLVAQQNLIGRSLSATTYVFPVSLGAIAAMEIVFFNGRVSGWGIFSITILFLAGLVSLLFGHLQTMPTMDKKRYAVMVGCVIGFGVCDKFGVDAAGWYGHLLYTGIGNLITATVFVRFDRLPTLRTWPCIGAIWTIPELFFVIVVSGWIPVTYGYLALSLRIPLLVFVSAVVLKEGTLSGQLLFCVVALAGVVPLIFFR